jgi:hypothetical protein
MNPTPYSRNPLADLSGLNATGRAAVARLAMPSETSINIPITVNGQNPDFTAPADGFVTAHVDTSGSLNRIVSLNNKNTGIGQHAAYTTSSTTSAGVQAYVPCRAGDVVSVYVYYAGTLLNRGAQFVYCVGTAPQEA